MDEYMPSNTPETVSSPPEELTPEVTASAEAAAEASPTAAVEASPAAAGNGAQTDSQSSETNGVPIVENTPQATSDAPSDSTLNISPEVTLVPPAETTSITANSTPGPTAAPTATPGRDDSIIHVPFSLLAAGAGLLLVLFAAVIVLLAKRRPTPARKKANSNARKPAAKPLSSASSAEKPSAVSDETFPSTKTPKPALNEPKYRLGYAETIGKRKQQEDSRGASNPGDAALIARQGLLAVVADGIGGLGDGQVASNTAVRAMLSAFEKQDPNTPASSRLLHLAALAQNSVASISQQNGKRLGCTLVSVLLHNDGLSFLSIGDSRICLLRSGALLTLNREHVLGREHDEQVALGKTSEAMEHARRIRITSYIGIKNLTLIDRNIRPIRLMPGDKILLMSDGVFNALSEEELIACMNAPAMQAAGQAIRAVESKNYPGQDNATIMVIEYP